MTPSCYPHACVCIEGAGGGDGGWAEGRVLQKIKNLHRVFNLKTTLRATSRFGSVWFSSVCLPHAKAKGFNFPECQSELHACHQLQIKAF